MTESEFEHNLRSPENLFKGDYINEFIWLDVNLKDLKGGHMTMDEFIGLSQRVLQNKGLAVKKFSERYENTSIPQKYVEAVKKLDDLADEINVIFKKFLISKDDKDRDRLMNLVDEGMKEIKP